MRDFRAADGAALNDVALAAFSQFKAQYSNWPAMAGAVSRMSQLGGTGELMVCELGGRIVGGVAYIPGGRPKAEYFERSWAIMRMLVVEPAARGRGIGRRLTEACIARARRDRAPCIALHTTEIMTVAHPMYLRMGFVKVREAPPVHGVPYAVFTKAL